MSAAARGLASPRSLAASIALACLRPIAPGMAAAAPSVVIKPSPGQHVTNHPFRLIVRAGPESGDLRRA